MIITSVARKLVISGCVAFLFLANSLCARKMPEWTFAVYMEAGTPDMHYWIHKNMNDMALANSDHKYLNIVTQVHIERFEAWRYVVCRGAIKPVESVVLGNDCGQNIVDFMRWIVQKYPAKHYGLICWGHAFGILDPSYQPTSTDPFNWDVIPDEPEYGCSGGVCPLKMVDFVTSKHIQHRTCNEGTCAIPLRGFLFNDIQSFVNNGQMVSMLKAIKESVLNGKKLDILGTDCCKMAMLEVAYQVKEFTNFLVGSQNCELKDGWNYRDFFGSFNEKPLSALEVVQAIVKTYGMYYEKNTIYNTYTLSALDLSQLGPLVANLNGVVAACGKLMEENKTMFKTILFNARSQAPSMCQASYYLDLGAVYANFFDELSKADAGTFNAETVTALKTLLTQGQDLIKTVVVASAAGTAVTKLHGISIYFPRNRIDESYPVIPFCQETAWLNFLQAVVG